MMTGPINWRSKLPQTFSLSSTEAQYKATAEAGQEAVWLIDSLKFLQHPSEIPIILHCNNLSAIHLTTKSIFHARTEHIEIEHHWIRELVKIGKVKINCCPTTNMIADLLTKTLNKQFLHHRGQVGFKEVWKLVIKSFVSKFLDFYDQCDHDIAVLLWVVIGGGNWSRVRIGGG